MAHPASVYGFADWLSQRPKSVRFGDKVTGSRVNARVLASEFLLTHINAGGAVTCQCPALPVAHVHKDGQTEPV